MLLRITVLKEQGTVLKYRHEEEETFQVGGPNHTFAPLPLRNGNYLGLSIQLFLDKADGNKLKVSKARYQYQLDSEGRRWVFRYEYLREPADRHPSAHLHVRGALYENCLPSKEKLERVHFPTNRVPLEAVIRLLVDHFDVPCAKPENVWRPVLSEAEETFLGIAHGPSNPRQAASEGGHHR